MDENDGRGDLELLRYIEAFVQKSTPRVGLTHKFEKLLLS